MAQQGQKEDKEEMLEPGGAEQYLGDYGSSPVRKLHVLAGAGSMGSLGRECLGLSSTLHAVGAAAGQMGIGYW